MVPAPWPVEQRDPRELVELRAQEGWISTVEAHRLHAWLDRLAPLVLAGPSVFVHADVQLANVLLRPGSRHYAAVVDWGNSHIGDATGDFCGVPLAAGAAMLDGYRSESESRSCVTEASILWHRMRKVFAYLPRGAAPGLAWGERPVAWLTDLLLHLHDRQDRPWRDLAPAALV